MSWSHTNQFGSLGIISFTGLGGLVSLAKEMIWMILEHVDGDSSKLKTPSFQGRNDFDAYLGVKCGLGF